MRFVGLLLRGLCTLVLVWSTVNLRFPDPTAFGPAQMPPDTPAQLDWLHDALADGAAEDMQSVFPEGYMFTWALYGLSHVQYGLRHPPGSKPRISAEAEARHALAMLGTADARRPFAEATDPPLGAFYNGWSNWLRGGLLLLQAPNARADEVEAFKQTCAAIAAALRTKGPYLESYPDKRWPADTVVAAATLRLHDVILPPRYEGVLDRWMAQVEQRLDPLGLIPHAIGGPGTDTMQPARGSSQALILRFFFDIDPQRTRKWYRTFRQNFVTKKAGLPAVLEYPKGKSGAGDVDSGPLVAGASAPAMVVNIGTALQLGDRAYAEVMIPTIEFVGFSIPGKRYAFGMLPVGDAFLAWSKSARPLTRAAMTDAYSPVVSEWFRWPWHGLAAFFMLLLWIGPLRRWIKGR